jgi:hypothetical protein
MNKGVKWSAYGFCRSTIDANEKPVAESNLSLRVVHQVRDRASRAPCSVSERRHGLGWHGTRPSSRIRFVLTARTEVTDRC